jgi:hypothetical protein
VAGISLILASLAARAEGPPGVLLVRTGQEPPCLDLADLARRIQHATGADVRVGAAPPASSRDTVVVTTGTTQRLVVTLQVGGSNHAEVLRATSCDAATNVVAAFVISALAPPPAVRVTGPPVPTEVLERDVADVLARRGIRLTGSFLSFSDTPDGNRTATLRRTTGRCTQTRSLGPVDAATASDTASASSVVSEMAEAQDLCVQSEARADRAAALWTQMDAYLERRYVSKEVGLVLAGIGAIDLGLKATVLHPDAHAPATWVAGGADAIAVVGGIATFLASDDDYDTILRATSFAAAGAYDIALYGFTDSADASSATFHPLEAAGGLGLLGTSALTMANAFIRRPIGKIKIAAASRQIETPEQRLRLSAEQLGRLEADFRRTISPISPWLISSPAIAGGLASMTAFALDSRYSSAARVSGALGGGFACLLGLLYAFELDDRGSYASQLQARHGGPTLAIAPAPGAAMGVALTGRF